MLRLAHPLSLEVFTIVQLRLCFELKLERIRQENIGSLNMNITILLIATHLHVQAENAINVFLINDIVTSISIRNSHSHATRFYSVLV